MKFTKLIAASFAALTMFSCSEEVTDMNQSLVKPGDARYVLNLQNGQTTYATGTEEQAIKSLLYAVYKADGSPLTVTDNSGGVGRVDFTVAATDYDALATKKVTLCVLANSSTTAKPATLAAFEALSEGRNPNTNVGTNGLVAYKKIEVDLSSSNVIMNATVLSRGVARFWVKAAGTYGRGAIVGASVNMTGASNSVKVFTGAGSTVATPDTYTYTINSTAPTSQFNSQESAFYAYPTASGASISVTLGGETVNVPVLSAIEANKNYSITITPKTGAGGKQVIDNVVIAEWNPTAGGDFDVDFTGGASKIPFKSDIVLPAGFTIESGVLLIDANLAGAAIMNKTQGVSINTTDLLGEKAVISIEVDGKKGSIATRGLNGNDEVISADGQFAISDFTEDLTFFALPNYQNNKTYIVKVVGGTSKKIHTFDVVVKGMNLPANFSTMFNGIEVMSVHFPNMKDGYMGAVNLVNAVNEAYPSGNFQENLSAYAVANLTFAEAYCKNGVANTNRADFGTKPQFTCPAGYRFFSGMREIQTFLGLVSFTYASDVVMPVDVATPINPGASVTTMYHEYHATNQWQKHHILSDGLGGKLAIIGNENFVDVYASTPARVIFWDKTVQQKQALTNNYIRCVKDTAIPASFK